MMRYNVIPEFSQLDRDIEKAFAALYLHARNKAAYLNDLRQRGSSEEQAEAAWFKELDSQRTAVDAAYAALKDHIYPRKA
jgi:hypothetical protein